MQLFIPAQIEKVTMFVNDSLAHSSEAVQTNLPEMN